MALKILLNDEQGNVTPIYLKREDIKNMSFGHKETYPNRFYDENDPESQKELLLEYVKITFYEKIDVEVPYTKVTGEGNNRKEVKSKRKETVNAFWMVTDKEQFAYLEQWAEINL